MNRTMEPIYDSVMDIEVTLEDMVEIMEWSLDEDPTGPDGSYHVEFVKYGKQWTSDSKVTVENGKVNKTEALQAAGEVAFKSGYYDGHWIEIFDFVPEKQAFCVRLGS